jgi:2-methylcitrate dehydratase PrpD
MSKHLHTARAAESGVLAATLAKQGFTGPERILEGEKGLFAGACPDPVPGAVAAEPERPWELTRTSIKPWPCCRHTHPAIDAAIELHGVLGGARVRQVEVGAYRAALDVCNRPRPEDLYSARFSLQHTVAIALADGKVDQASFDASARKRMAGERGKVDVSLSATIDAAYPKRWGVEIEVVTADGRRLSASRRDAKGDPENPVTPVELKAKAAMLLDSGGLAPKVSERLIATISSLVEDRPVRDLGLRELMAGDG